MNPNVKSYERYGKRGIEFRYESFDEFLSELGERPTSNHSLSRLLDRGHYEPGNVVWGDREHQSVQAILNNMLVSLGIEQHEAA